MELATVQQGHPEVNNGYIAIILVIVTGNPIILLICCKTSSDLHLLKYDCISDDESLVSAIALLFNY